MDLTPYDDPQDAVGVAFRLTRRRLRLSQRELAEVLGWDASAVGRWESGHVSSALGRVDGVLRGMGFRLAVVVTDPEDWADVEAPVEHIADRGHRHLPAHLDQMVLQYRPLHWFLRYRDKPNPMAPDWSFEMRPQDRRRARRRRGRPLPPPPPDDAALDGVAQRGGSSRGEKDAAEHGHTGAADSGDARVDGRDDPGAGQPAAPPP